MLERESTEPVWPPLVDRPDLVSRGVGGILTGAGRP